MPVSNSPAASGPTYQLMKVALGEAAADLAIVNGAIVNVYTSEVRTGDTVLVKGDRIAYVGPNASKSIGPNTLVIDATAKTVIPGLIDGHTHINYPYLPSEVARYAARGGTTTIITELIELVFPFGYQGFTEFMSWVKNQPVKIYAVVPSMVTISPIAREHLFTTSQLRRLLRRKDVVGLGETYWAQAVEGNQQLIEFITETKKAGKKLDGHSAGARGNKLQAYASLGISSCHEPTTAEEVIERLRLGMFVLLREGEIRRELEEIIPRIKDANIDFRRLAVASDGLGPWQLMADGYMDFLVQKLIDLGLNPVTAIQMVTLNVAQRFALDDSIGGIAPGRYADMVIIPDLATIKAQCVISNGRVIYRNGEMLVTPRKITYSQIMQNSIHLGKSFTAGDFAVPVASNRSQIKVRVIDQVTDLITREAILELPVSGGLVLSSPSRDVIKVAAIERTFAPGKTFTGFIRGIGIRRGAMASSISWDACDIIAIGADEADMAQAVNRVAELNGGMVVCDNGQILAELALPLGGYVSPEPMETIAQKLRDVQQAAASLGYARSDIRLTSSVLTTSAIPFLRICETGLVDLKENRFVDLIVD